MARRKGTADFLQAFLGKPGATKAGAARALNRSLSTVNRVLRGASSGESLREGAKELARKAPAEDIRLKNAPPPAPAARVAAERTAPVPVAIAPGIERNYLGGGARETIFQGTPAPAVLKRDLGSGVMHQVQIRLTFGNGKQITVFGRGGADPNTVRALMARHPNFLADYLAGRIPLPKGVQPMNYPEELIARLGGIARTELVLL